MRAGHKAQADSKPQQLNIKHLYGDIYELSATAGIEEIEQKPRRGEEDSKPRQAFVYTEYTDTKALAGYEEAVAALVGLKYTTGDEIALTRKGFADSAGAEYTAYIAYVDECKNYAREFFKTEGSSGGNNG